MANSTQQSSLKVYLRLLRYVVPYWGIFALSILGFLIFASTQPMLGYMLKYRSYAVADGMQMIELPAEINLGDPAFAERYAKASVSIKGKGDQKITMQGEPVVYGLTIPTSAKNGARALEFVQFLLSPEGKQILEKRGFGLMPPTPATPRDKLPAELAPLAAAQ